MEEDTEPPIASSMILHEADENSVRVKPAKPEIAKDLIEKNP